jgi:chorismate dehydratase
MKKQGPGRRAPGNRNRAPGTGHRGPETARPGSTEERGAGFSVGAPLEGAPGKPTPERQRPEAGARSPEPVSIVGVRFLNARPLLAGLEAGIPGRLCYHLATAEPSACADELACGNAVAGLIPVAALPEIPDAFALPSLGVAARREVRSVLLITRQPLSRIRTLAAHTASRTSVVLARLLLAERWGARPQVVPARPPLSAMLEVAEAAVLIGDPALRVCGRTGFEEVDLAAAWAEWTGLPFVFAVWGVRDPAPSGIGRLLEESFTFAAEHWAQLVPQWAEAHDVDVAATRDYLGETLSYRLADAERKGAEEFLRRAADAGLLHGRREVWRAVE